MLKKKRRLLCKWKIVAKLPVERGQQKALGFAGPVAGVHENVMIIAGGANFPDSMPWQNGRKNIIRNFMFMRRWAHKL
jgi:N-acetylneuraminic acid mutarotase